MDKYKYIEEEFELYELTRFIYVVSSGVFKCEFICLFETLLHFIKNRKNFIHNFTFDY